MELTPHTCSGCHQIFQTLNNLTNLASEEGYQHHDRQSLINRATQGCQLCRIIWNTIEIHWDKDENQTLFLKAEFEYQNDEGDENDVDPHPFRLAANDNPAAKYIKQRPIPLDLCDESVTSQMVTWLEDCQKGHECSSKAHPSILPTRVLDISGSQPSLHVSPENEIGEYVALSYCWGGPQAVLTTTTNIESNKQELSLNKLPTTLQNAIQVTQNLGFSYLWIDALCIIQDSLEDKAIEINKMGSIYRNVTLTIFAANASSVNEGFCNPESQMRASYYHSTSPTRSKEPTKELLWRCQAQEYKRVTSSPRYYVPLTVHFPSDTFHPAKLNGFNYQTPKQVQQSRIRTWNTMVQDLTSRGITEKDDRLPAIAGIASELQTLWSDECIVGLWRRNLAAHLCWYPVKAHPTSTLPRPAVYRAPSWSWACLDCAVDFRNVNTVEVEVVKCSMRLRSPQSALGWVSSAELVLKAKVVAMGHVEAEILRSGKFFQDIDTETMHISDTYFMLIGFQTGWAAVGLVLKMLEDGKFVRTGSFFHRDDVRGLVAGGAGSRVWNQPEVVLREVTIL
ncbi:HET-domain-containing protein [Cadophora sp. DSE1049]|nr:HET-domain-containing protein [Cadophora sp. DSE1049]